MQKSKNVQKLQMRISFLFGIQGAQEGPAGGSKAYFWLFWPFSLYSGVFPLVSDGPMVLTSYIVLTYENFLFVWKPGGAREPAGPRRSQEAYFWLWCDGAGFVKLNKTESLIWQSLICFRVRV